MIDPSDSTDSPLSHWALDREIVLSRVVKAPIALVFEAWANPQHLPQWFGPAGFSVVTRSIDIRVGGEWLFDMTAPDGTLYANRIHFLRIEPQRLIQFDHGTDKDDPQTFRTTITFDEQADGKTVVTLRQLHPTSSRREAGIGFGAVEFGYQTLDKMAEYAVGLT